MALAPGTVLGKTELGREAMQRRTLPLTPRQRAILISINGRLTVGELCKRFGAGGAEAQIAELIDDLATRGLVESLGQGAQSSAAAATAASPAATGLPAAGGLAGGADWRELRVRASQLLHDFMGPDADMLTMRLESAPNEQEFMTQLQRAFDLVAAMHGPGAAERMRNRMMQADQG
ncbi:MAG: hypothetical protein KF823_04985 [Xanthomonadales bacterium]|nr:hypothetical protein [Xanthomonadales bacterium]